MPTPAARYLRRTIEAAHDHGFHVAEVDHGLVIGDDSRKVERAADSYNTDPTEQGVPTVRRVGHRLVAADGSGYSDTVSDVEIRSHLFASGDKNPEFLAFAFAVLAIRDYEQVVARRIEAQS